MGVCYMMQYMDKLALSQATLFNLRQDLVCPLFCCDRSVLIRTASRRHRIHLDVCNLLFRIFRLELAQFLPHRTLTDCQVHQRLSVRYPSFLRSPLQLFSDGSLDSSGVVS